MASKAVIDAVMARLAANWTLCPIVTDNVDTRPPASGATYLEVQFPLANEEQITIGAPGSNLFRERGVIRLVLAIRTGDPLDEALGWLDRLRSLFRGKQFSGVTTYAPSPSVQDNSEYADSTRVLLSSAVPYHADLFA